MTKNILDDILEGLYKLRIRVSEKLKTVLELYDLEIHQKKIGLDFQKLKTMVKTSTKQDIRNEFFGAMDKEFLEIVGNGSPTGSVLEETIAVSVAILTSVQN